MSDQLSANLLTDYTARTAMNQAVASLGEYPGGYRGRGIVICGGGLKYFPCAWVNIRLLRHVGCKLPIELWYLGPDEVSTPMRQLLEEWDVRCVDALDVRRVFPARILEGWPLKPYATIHSRFEEVLFLDADNTVIRDPSFLFNDRSYQANGAMFWPDYTKFDDDHIIWRLTGVAYRDEAEFESGQFVVNKTKCWKPLLLAMWMNEHSDYWYRRIYGDKDTFRLAWRRLHRLYALPRYPVRPIGPRIAMAQCSPDGELLFQHGRKWQLGGHNPIITGYQFEAECLGWLDELDKAWPRPVMLQQTSSQAHG